MSETVTGYIDHVIFRNEDNGYTVMVLKGMEEERELTCVGTFPAITQGAAIEASGNYTTHPVYGKQFQIASYVEKMPEDALAMERYLGSGAIKGIGAALAARIVRRFGDDTMRIVEEEPERLAEIKGISEKKGHGDRRTDDGESRYAPRYDLSPEIRDITESRRKDLSEIWADCIWSPAGESVSPCRGYQWCGIPYRR